MPVYGSLCSCHSCRCNNRGTPGIIMFRKEIASFGFRLKNSLLEHRVSTSSEWDSSLNVQKGFASRSLSSLKTASAQIPKDRIFPQNAFEFAALAIVIPSHRPPNLWTCGGTVPSWSRHGHRLQQHLGGTHRPTEGSPSPHARGGLERSVALSSTKSPVWWAAGTGRWVFCKGLSSF